MPDDFGVSVSFVGEEQARHAFALFADASERALIQALAATAEWATPIIAANAPVGTRDDRTHTPGQLRDSIGHSPIERTADGPEIRIGTGEPYGRRVELGYRGTDSAGRSYEQDPEPYIGPVVDELVPHLIKEIKIQ